MPDLDSNACIQIHNARTHNLKNVSLSIPRQQLVVLTGRSGSGKSSLAINTLFAEGQRQYIESLSLYSRQFFSQLPRAAVDRIDGLQPSLAIGQHRSRFNRRSTVGTLTEIYDFLRLLMARVGTVHCYGCQSPIQQANPVAIRDKILELPERSKVMILAPVAVAKIGSHQETFRTIRDESLVRVRVDQEIFDIEQTPMLDPQREHTIEAVTDRIIVREGVASRLLEAIDNAVRISADGQVVCCWLPDGQTDWQEKLYSTKFACPDCDIYYAEVQPRSFSFNNPLGACQTCYGLGTFTQFTPDAVIDRTRSIDDGAIIAWQSHTATQRKKLLKWLTPIVNRIGLNTNTPLSQISDDDFQTLMHHHDRESPGLSLVLEKERVTTHDDQRLEQLEAMRREIACYQCGGSRVSQQARSVFVGGQHIGMLVTQSIDDLSEFFDQWQLPPAKQPIADPLTHEIRSRLRFLRNVGVGYLSLSRSSDSLSGGEHQRVRLASSVGAGVTSVCFVLDEPSTGLHARDTDRLLTTLREIQAAGNSLVVVEHDDAIIEAADHVIEMGPGAGNQGGNVVTAGSPSEIKQCSDSITGAYLSGTTKIVRRQRQTVEGRPIIEVRRAAGNNLQTVNVSIPLQVLCVVSGVSGSGKSTLIGQTLVPAARWHFDLLAPQPAEHESITGLDHIDHLVVVDQKPIGRSPRACPATFCGLLDELRKLFVATKRAKQLGYGKGRFTFNTKTGWCAACQGLGHRKVEMSFMPDTFVRCDACQGRRFNLQTLQVKFAGYSIADVLSLTVDQARQVFENFSRLKAILGVLSDVGLGYLTLGQPATTLSGGEAQRLKLARELVVQPTDIRKTLFVLDEPTSGLHSADVQLLLDVLDRLVQQGHSVLVIEHHLDVIRAADWVIDLGPGGGIDGGQVIATGPPEQIKTTPESITGQWL